MDNKSGYDGFMYGLTLRRKRENINLSNDKSTLVNILEKLTSDREEKDNLIENLRNQIQKRDEVIAQLKEQVSIQNAHSQARVVLIDTYYDTHPDSPLHKVIGTRKDGKPLTKARQILIDSFDRIARELGIKNPEKHRVG